MTGASKTVVFLHGLAGDHSEWRAVAAALAGSWRAVAPDARGHGAGERRPADVSREAFVADAVEAIRSVGHPVLLVGQSLGGITALLTAAGHPDLVEALVLVEAGPERPGPDTPDMIGGWLDSWPLPFADRAAAAAFFGGGSAGEGWAATLGDDGRPRFDRDTIVAVIAAACERSYWTEWQAIRCPALVIRGESGFLAPAEVARMRETRPDIPVTTVPGAGHDVHLEAPERVATLLTALGYGRQHELLR